LLWYTFRQTRLRIRRRLYSSSAATLGQAPVAERPIVLPPVQGRSTQVAPLFFTCPTTHREAPTGIETDVQSLQAVWKATLKIKCRHCGEVHEEPAIEKLWFRNWVCVLGQTRGRAYTPWTAPLAGSKLAPTLPRQPRPHHLAGFSLSHRLPSLAWAGT